jgi:3-oxoacyl-[acyl-carrier protein] reductase
MTLLDSKVAIVTGAGRGIGSEIAQMMALEGAQVVAHYHCSREQAEKLASSLPNSMAYGADLSNPSEARLLVDAVIDRYGRIDILVNCASTFIHDIAFENDDWASYKSEFEGVFGTTFHITKEVVPHMKLQGSGRIINFAATLTSRPLTGYGAHTAAKGAVLAFTKVIAKELGQYNITVNAISPGATLTEYSKNRPESVQKNIAARTPLRRIADPSDVAKAVLFFASDLSAFVTGANIAPDGGLSDL